ncbi:MAG: adenosylcobinamide-GDP ribazoletransferase [Spirochaetota bacterium]|nr:adenosylcobinamide-GDP ribazoletransferase [Spirochaetota bacterium]
MFKHQVNTFFAALTFLTRIPSPSWVKYSEEYFKNASIYFPLVGWIVGAIGALFYFGASYLFPKSISLIISMIATILTTGAFHEDGFADFCDGFGGGYSKEQILTIMKDSRLGTYGAIGIISILGFKYLSLNEIEHNFIPIALISAHSLSRFMCLSIIYKMNNISDLVKSITNQDSKSKPLTGKVNLSQLIVAFIFSILPLILFWDFLIFLIIIPVTLVTAYFGYYFYKKLDGYTGDCLGAVQQVSEITFYIVLVTYPWKFI